MKRIINIKVASVFISLVLYLFSFSSISANANSNGVVVGERYRLKNSQSELYATMYSTADVDGNYCVMKRY